LLSFRAKSRNPVANTQLFSRDPSTSLRIAQDDRRFDYFRLKSLRIGCVKYLNARPLIHGWPGDVDFDHPSALCQQLADGELDVALVSSFEFLRNPIYRIVDDVSISSDGPVYSVVVAHRDDISAVEQIELDPASKTAANLLRCLLAELELKPRFIPAVPGTTPKAFGVAAGSPPKDGFAVANLPATSNARLLIGDQAIRFRQKHAAEFHFWDLGEEWKRLTGVPFVYALWLIRPEIAEAKSIAQRLRELRDKNLANLDHLIGEAVAGGGDPGPPMELHREFLSRYFRKHLQFSFGKNEKQGLQRFADLCAKHGVLLERNRTFSVV
jgi:chorismate dehydratase